MQILPINQMEVSSVTVAGVDMNQILFDFYSGTGVDIRNRSFDEIMELGDNFLERSHDIVQWIFPLTEPSLHNPKAPLLDQETIDAFLANRQCRHNLERAGVRFYNFLLNKKDETGKPVWITPHNHNYLRITRIIKCYKLFGMDNWARYFFELADEFHDLYPKEIGQETLEYWIEAIGDVQETNE